MKKRRHKLSGSELREERSEKYGCDGYCTWFDPEENQDYVCGMFDECEENALDHLITNIIFILFMDGMRDWCYRFNIITSIDYGTHNS